MTQSALAGLAHMLKSVAFIHIRPNPFREEPPPKVAAMLPGPEGAAKWVAFGPDEKAATRALAAKLLADPPDTRIVSAELAQGLGVRGERVRDMELRGQLVQDGSVGPAKAWTAASVWAVARKRKL
jgi:hypothetical protein